MIRALLASLSLITASGLALAQEPPRPMLRTVLEAGSAIPGQPILLRITLLAPTWFPKPPVFASLDIPNVVVHLNRDIVARPAPFIAENAGLTVPEDTRFLMVIGEKVGPEDRFSGEKISPVLTVWKWDDFDEMLDRLDKILQFSGEGHSVSIHSENDERRVKLALQANVGRVVCNMPHAHANSGGWNTGLPTTDTLGCGSWAGNIFSGNINWENFLNYTLLSIPKEEYIPTEEELCGAYLKKWGRD